VENLLGLLKMSLSTDTFLSKFQVLKVKYFVDCLGRKNCVIGDSFETMSHESGKMSKEETLACFKALYHPLPV
jgi:hypothetical protein